MPRPLARLLRTARNALHGTGLGDIPAVRRAYDALIARAKEPGGEALVQGYRMALDPGDHLNLSALGVYERAATELVLAHVHPGDIVVDLGANIGYFTLLLAGRVGPSGKVYAFEPEPENFALLRENVRRNGLDSVVICSPCAVADVPGRLRLFRSENPGDHRIYDSRDDRPSVEVEVVRLDDAVPATEAVAFLKMDIQGSEGKALAGMTACLERSPRLKILTEFWPFGLRLAGTAPAAFLASLEAGGFALELVRHNRIEPVRAAALATRYDPSRDDFSADLFCVRRPPGDLSEGNRPGSVEP